MGNYSLNMQISIIITILSLIGIIILLTRFRRRKLLLAMQDCGIIRNKKNINQLDELTKRIIRGLLFEDRFENKRIDYIKYKHFDVRISTIHYKDNNKIFIDRFQMTCVIMHKDCLLRTLFEIAYSFENKFIHILKVDKASWDSTKYDEIVENGDTYVDIDLVIKYMLSEINNLSYHI